MDLLEPALNCFFAGYAIWAVPVVPTLSGFWVGFCPL